MLKSCGFGMQFIGGMFLVAGLIGLACRVFSGSWLPIVEREWSPLVSGLLTAAITLVGAGYIVLGSRIKAGSQLAALTSVVLAWAVWLTTLAYFLATWKCVYELVLPSILLLDAHVALIEVGRTKTEKERRRPGVTA